MLGAPILVAVSAPTALAVRIAEDADAFHGGIAEVEQHLPRFHLRVLQGFRDRPHPAARDGGTGRA